MQNSVMSYVAFSQRRILEHWRSCHRSKHLFSAPLFLLYRTYLNRSLQRGTYVRTLDITKKYDSLALSIRQFERNAITYVHPGISYLIGQIDILSTVYTARRVDECIKYISNIPNS